jgi:divalent metal cation (Fe/Co/Zn/Cd) transporter
MLGGNGIANIIAALIVAAAIIWTGGFGGREASAPSDEEYAEWLTRAVGDIRNDIVVNCGCCGEGEEGQRRAASRSF